MMPSVVRGVRKAVRSMKASAVHGAFIDPLVVEVFVDCGGLADEEEAKGQQNARFDIPFVFSFTTNPPPTLNECCQCKFVRILDENRT
jgi:hypothetical protein